MTVKMPGEIAGDSLNTLNGNLTINCSMCLYKYQ